MHSFTYVSWPLIVEPLEYQFKKSRKALSRFSKQEKQTFTLPMLHDCTPLTQNTVAQADRRWSTKLSKWFNHGTSFSMTDPNKSLQDMML